eukprot:gene26255-biopygen15332
MNSGHEGIEAADPAKRIDSFDFGRERPPRDMGSSGTGHCYGGIDDSMEYNPIGKPKEKLHVLCHGDQQGTGAN